MRDLEAHLDAAVAVRQLALPVSAPPGPLDAVVGYLLARAAPFDQDTQLALRRQHGWTTAAPASISDVRTHGRWIAVPRLRQLTETPAPSCLQKALDLLAAHAPFRSGDAVALLLGTGLLAEAMHPGGVLSLAKLYSTPTTIELTRRGEVTWLWPVAARQARRRCLWRLVADVSLRGVGAVDLRAWAARYGVPAREVEVAVAVDSRIGFAGGIAWRVNDRGSGLSRQVVRLLGSAEGRLDLASLHNGIRRARRYSQAPAPSRRQLDLWLSGQPWLVVDGGLARLVGPLTDRQRAWTTSFYTGVLARTLRAAPSGVLSHAELVEALIAAGHGPRGAPALVAAAPNIERAKYGYYRLRGQ